MSKSFRRKVQTLRLLRWPLVAVMLVCLAITFDLPIASFGRDAGLATPSASVALTGGRSSRPSPSGDETPAPLVDARSTEHAASAATANARGGESALSEASLPLPDEARHARALAEALGESLESQAPGTGGRPEPITEPTALTIVNAAGRPVAVSFLVDDQAISLAAGESRSFDGAYERRIEFHRGGTFGEAEMTLAAGEHRFVLTRQGWDLRPTKPASAAP